MRVLVACEYSGRVREAFRKLGHDAWSCDLIESEDNSPHHIIGDAIEVAYNGQWDLMIAHPPCTDLAVSGAAWFANKRLSGAQQASASFFMKLGKLDIPRIAIENPVCVMSSLWRKPDQVIQPWMFGHMEQKATCLWLKGLPPLTQTNNVKEEMMKLPKNQRERLHYLPPSADRWKLRSETYLGIAQAMASQWGSVSI